LVILCLAGCTTWGPTTMSPRQLVQEQQPGHIRVLRTDGTHVDMREPWLAMDSVVGIVRGRRGVPATGGTARRRNVAFVDTVSIALTDISAVETRRRSVGRTVVLVAALAPVVYVAGLYAFLELACGGPDECN
jgi:hypothetical protein